MSTPNLKPSTLYKIRGIENWKKISNANLFSESPLWFKSLINQDEMPPRVAFAISKNYGSAVKRNKCKRRIKSVIRQLVIDNKIQPGTWILIGVSKKQNNISFSDIEKSCNTFALKIAETYSNER